MTALLTVLGAFLCSLLVSSEVLPQADFNVQGMAGKWHLIGFATNAQWFVSHRGSMKRGTAMFTPTADGDLDVSYASLNPDGSCWRMQNLARKTVVPGKFTYRSETWGDDVDMRMVEVKYDEYALTHTITTKNGVSTTVNKLYGRVVDLSPDLLDKFRQFSSETGIIPENIAILPQNGECQTA